MQYITKLKLAAVQQLYKTIKDPKEPLIDVMQKLCNVDSDTCIKYLNKEDHAKLINDLSELENVLIKFEKMNYEL